MIADFHRLEEAWCLCLLCASLLQKRRSTDEDFESRRWWNQNSWWKNDELTLFSSPSSPFSLPIRLLMVLLLLPVPFASSCICTFCYSWISWWFYCACALVFSISEWMSSGSESTKPLYWTLSAQPLQPTTWLINAKTLWRFCSLWLISILSD